MAHYWPYYCEENVWHLAATCEVPGCAIFVSNALQQVLLLHQRAGEPPAGMVLWDYHVIWAEYDGDACCIRDADSTLAESGELIPLEQYVHETFPELQTAFAEFAPRFRVIPAALFLNTFASDRRHMRAGNGDWLQKPPPWPCIGSGHTLAELMQMVSPGPGDVVGLTDLPATIRSLCVT